MNGAIQVTTVKKSLRIPITNVYANGDYCLSLKVGSEKKEVNVILDTGSSTFALHPLNYQPQTDSSLNGTSYAQDVTYGMGGWTGPVVTTCVEIDGVKEVLTLNNAHMALATTTQQLAFAKADGILGLGYHGLNKSYNLQSYFEQHKLSPASTWPWSFPVQNNHQSIQNFKNFLWKFPEQDIPPLFTELESQGLTANKFAFSIQRSSIHNTEANASLDIQKQDPLNQGLLILGEGEAETDLYTGDFQTVQVLHDVYYNTQLEGIQVEGGDYIAAPELEPHYQSLYFSNSIVDSGASVIVLCHTLYQSLITSLGKLNPSFTEIIQSIPPFKGAEVGISTEKVNLNEWPDIHFFLKSSDNKTTQLTVPASAYWQENAPEYGLISFNIFTQLANWPNQSILGLPLLTPYYTVFDRSSNATGQILFANRKS